MKLKYVGPHDGVEITLPESGQTIPVERDGVVEIGREHEDFARALLDQPDNWQPATAGKTKPKVEPEGDATTPTTTTKEG